MRTLAAILWLALLVAACRDRDPAPTPAPPAMASDPGSVEDLAVYLRRVADADVDARQREIAGWELDRAAWDRTIVEPFRALYDRYDSYFDPRPLDRALAHGGAITTRRHFAGDPRLTPGQAMLRWVVPVLYPSAVAELDGQPIDTVFVHDGGRWRALAGLDGFLSTYVMQYAEGIQPQGGPQPRRAFDECVARILVVHRSVGCANVWFAATDAALRNDRARFDRMCQLATTLCDMRSP